MNVEMITKEDLKEFESRLLTELKAGADGRAGAHRKMAQKLRGEEAAEVKRRPAKRI